MANNGGNGLQRNGKLFSGGRPSIFDNKALFGAPARSARTPAGPKHAAPQSAQVYERSELEVAVAQPILPPRIIASFDIAPVGEPAAAPPPVEVPAAAPPPPTNGGTPTPANGTTGAPANGAKPTATSGGAPPPTAEAAPAPAASPSAEPQAAAAQGLSRSAARNGRAVDLGRRPIIYAGQLPPDDELLQELSFIEDPRRAKALESSRDRLLDEVASELSGRAARPVYDTGGRMIPAVHPVDDVIAEVAQLGLEARVGAPLPVYSRAKDRSWIIEGPDLTAETRAFKPATHDKTGHVRLTVRVPNLPEGGTIRWNVPSAHHGNISLTTGAATITHTTTGASVDVLALRPGRTELDVDVLDASHTSIESIKFPISVPQFVTIDQLAAFDTVLALFQLDVNKADILAVAKEVSDSLLSAANVRTIWRIAPFNETLPAQFAAGAIGENFVTSLTLDGNPPAAGACGFTDQGTVAGSRLSAADFAARAGRGPDVFNERISIWLGGFDDAGNTDLDDATVAAIETLKHVGPVSNATRDLGIQMIGRTLGTILTHEIGHSLIGGVLTAVGHNASPGLANDIMNQGGDSTFRDVSGFEITTSPPQLSSLIDHGIGAIARFRNAGLTAIQTSFPIPPTFT